MNRTWFKPFSVAVLALSLTAASCDNLPTDPTAPETQQVTSVQQTPTVEQTPPQMAPASFSQFNGPVSAIFSTNGYHIVDATPLPLKIDVDLLGLLGGVLNAGSQKLTVPLGSVLQTTVFTMVQLPTPYISVQLTAVTGTLFNLLDIGGQGFLKPVQLSLSYANAIGVTDPSHLRIAELKWNGEIGEVLPTTYNPTTKKVTAYLPHFSTWVVICD